jgi:hypothetical protein
VAKVRSYGRPSLDTDDRPSTPTMPSLAEAGIVRSADPNVTQPLNST